MTIREKYLAWKDTPNHAPFNLKNIWAFIQGMWRKKVYINPTHAEQVEYRKSLIRPECKEAGVCTFCGCDIESKPYEDRPCEGHCYFNFLNKEDWNSYKDFLKDKTN